MKKIIAIDFDGTLVTDKSPLIGEPNMNLINWIKLNRNNFIFILYTCRTGYLLRNAIEYLNKEHNLIFDYVNENALEQIDKYGGDCRKISADYYIDDRNINIEELDKIC